uniref:KWG Leptospira repeat protein n=1 Tax=Cyanothece sp. (strain PCC 7425 / ATCC 29141) TaxID=395961 RepID=B8HNA7_CYAP4
MKQASPAKSAKLSSARPSPLSRLAPWFTGIATTIAVGLILDYGVAPRLIDRPVIGEVVLRLCRVTNANCGRSRPVSESSPIATDQLSSSPAAAEPESAASTSSSRSTGAQDNNSETIDVEQLLAIAPQFEEAQSFSEGLAAVKKGGQWGFIDRSGAMVIPPQFDQVEPFQAGVAKVTLDHKTEFIDTTGVTVDNPPPPQSSATATGDLVPTQTWGKHGFVDRSGKVIIQPQFEDARPFTEDLAAVKIDGQWGFISNPLKM